MLIFVQDMCPKQVLPCLPILGVINQIWGQGVRVGTFKMSPTSLYWFITYNAPRGLTSEERTGAGLLDV